MFGNLTVNLDLDNTFIYETLLYKKQGGEYKLLPFKMPGSSFCDFFMTDKYFYFNFSAASDLPYPFTCPLPAATYEVRGYVPTLKNFPLALLHDGAYIFEAQLAKEGKTYWNGQTFVSVINIP